MKNKKKNSISTKKKLINLALCLGVISIGFTINSDILAQPLYPRYGLFQPYTKPRYPSRNQTGKTIADVLTKDAKFRNFVDGLEQAKLLEELRKSCPKEQPYCLTIFAPNDEAFNNLPRAVFNKYNQPENRSKILQYHLVQGRITKEDVDSGSKVTMAGHPIQITESSEGIYKLNTANGKHPSILTKNGVIIEIDQVLIPPDL
ncbi:MAG: fasciclin domain-containing protein [Nostocaceae cyanobacterium]|nr:fasciclin domain-containing protein [Nostocaceae cyanobacterium]